MHVRRLISRTTSFRKHRAHLQLLSSEQILKTSTASVRADVDGGLRVHTQGWHKLRPKNSSAEARNRYVTAPSLRSTEDAGFNFVVFFVFDRLFAIVSFSMQIESASVRNSDGESLDLYCLISPTRPTSLHCVSVLKPQRTLHGMGASGTIS